GDDLMVFSDRKMQFTPSSPCHNVLFFPMPFVLTVNLKSGSIDYNKTIWSQFLGQFMTWQANATLRKADEIKNGDVDTQSSDQRIHKALCLPERQVECHLAIASSLKYTVKSLWFLNGLLYVGQLFTL
ncbi:MAG: hypothetical protein NTV43_10430, partial [Methylococcales bacterium]|nr:hypothetical protein [Methylococcales bacterium]